MVRESADFRTAGQLVSSRGLLTTDLPAATGELCRIFSQTGQQVLCEAVGFDGQLSQLMPLQAIGPLSTGSVVVGLNRRMMAPVGPQLAG